MHDNRSSGLDDRTLLDIIKKCSYDGIFITDRFGETVFLNDSYGRITGHSSTELLGKNASVLKSLGILENSVFERVDKTHKAITMILDYKNQKEVLVTGIPIFDENGEYIAVVGNIRDMSELNKLKEKLARTKKRSITAEMELEKLQAKHDLEREYVANSSVMRDLTTLAARIAKVDSTILITGESGVGKDVYARLIRRLSEGEKRRPFVKVSCGAIPENLLESELFGYEEGAFTGAKKSGKPGSFELAENGIIFLDEIGELPPALQVKLLTVIQDREFVRLGGTHPVSMNARIIAATNKNLEDAVRRGEFRQDLYFRLNVITVEIPPLRDRAEDIIPLTVMFTKKLNEKHNMNRSLDYKVLQAFEKYLWPGNVRELANVIERLVVLSPLDVISEDQLPENIKDAVNRPGHGTLRDDLTLKDFLEHMERYRICKALDTGKTLKEITEELGIDQSTLTRKIQKYRLPKRNLTRYIHIDPPSYIK